MRIRAKISAEEFTELTRPKLKLFLSVDVVGSTDFKQRSHQWLNFFVSFYTEFADLLDAAVAAQGSNGYGLPGVRLWKSLGDELIFTTELKDRYQAEKYLKAFRQSLQEAADNWHRDGSKSDQKELRLKGTAWVAGFPVTNSEIPLELPDSATSDMRDYIGPQVDTGFRLKDFASPRKLVLSAELAYFLVCSGTSGVHLFFDGEHPMRGVLKGKPYPVTWIDCDGHHEGSGSGHSAKMNRLKDKLTGREPVLPEDLKQYLRLWLDDNHGRLRKPFIKADQFDDLCEWKEFQNSLDKAKGDLANLFLVREDAEQNDTQRTNEIPRSMLEFLEQDSN